MRKILSALVSMSLLAMPMLGLAAVEPAPEVDIMTTIERVTNWLFTVLIAVAAAFLVYGGFLFVTAAGNEDQLGQARTTLRYALIGVIVALLARGVVTFVRSVIVPVP